MLERFNEILWGIPLLVLLLGTGLLLTFRTGFVQFRLLVPSLRLFFRQWKGEPKEEGVSSFRALCTALAATVGTGNIAGVAGAIAIGGPGAVFWMWISGFIGMATKFTEAALAVLYSEKRSTGEQLGGPMYTIEKGLGAAYKPMSEVYCFFGLIAVLGVGNTTQINAVVTSAADAAAQFGIVFDKKMQFVLGAAMAAGVWAMVSGGASKIGSAAEFLVPLASILYLLLGIGVIVWRFDGIGQVFSEILEGAFSPKAVTGGAVGSAWTALRIGVSRGVFTNEAGMGTAAMAHGGAQGVSPVQQGMLGIVEVFLDTIVICTMTALIILLSGVKIPYGQMAGAELTALALANCYGNWVRVLLSVCLCCFALATVMGWGLYAGRCLEYLTGKISWKGFAFVQALGVMAGTVMESSWIWDFAEIANGLMAIPNLIALILLSGKTANFRLDSHRKICYDVPANSKRNYHNTR